MELEFIIRKSAIKRNLEKRENAMTEIEKKTGMTDAECEHLDNYYTENTFKAGTNLLNQGIKPGFVHNTLCY